MTITYSFGIIDFLHYGHIRMFKDAKKAGDKHIFGLVEDKAIVQFHGNTVSTYEERLSVLNGVAFVDEVWSQNSFDPLQNLKKIHSLYPEAKITLFVGSDRFFVPTEEYLASISGEIRVVPYYEKLSPRNIIAALTAKTERSKQYTSNLISTKASTLLALQSRITKATIEPIQVVTVEEALTKHDETFERLKKVYNGRLIVCRSSSTSEDCFESSNAGHFDSVLNVHSDSMEEVVKALEQVAYSYDTKADDWYSEQILVQSQTLDVVCSGVIFTRDVNSNLPYYLINYDESGSTDSVTSGAGGTSAWVLRRVAKENPPAKWRNLLAAVRELESILKKMVLDIEFAIRKDGSIVIFQVRPLAANYKYDTKTNDEHFHTVYEQEVRNYNCIRNYQDNSEMLLSDMAFWNPSEIIGVNPHYLDYSLYREIITKSAWCEGLLPLGYTNVADELMFRIGNKPYISVDYSFLALTPNALDVNLKKKLISYYCKKLINDKSAHDKIEFEIVHSCLDFSTAKRLQELKDYGFSDNEISQLLSALYAMTDNIINHYEEYLYSDMADLEELERERKSIKIELEKRNFDIALTLSSVYRLLSLIKKYGTPQFSRHARCAFISRSICKSMVAESLLPEYDIDVFMNSINTVASDFEYDFARYSSGQMSKAEFNNVYGHLRSGTYDILSQRYDQKIFQVNEGKTVPERKNKVVPEDIIEKMSSALVNLKFRASSNTIMSFLKKSLEQREYFKFIFTRSLSDVIEMIAVVGSKLDISRKDLSYLRVSDIYAAQYYTTTSDLRDFFNTIISKRKEIFEEKSLVRLPAFVESIKDLRIIEQSESRPNFVSTKKVAADVVMLTNEMNVDIKGKIVVIEKADPGYDWIFAKDIAGLITKYGGAASHMAIRCAEFALPAAIGCGAKIFNYVANSQRMEIDCNNKKIVKLY